MADCWRLQCHAVVQVVSLYTVVTVHSHLS